MAKGQIKELVEKYLKTFLEENNLELYNSEFKKEGRDWYLRIYIDKKDAEKNQYVSTDDCEKVSRFLSECLDKDDPISQNYMLEVSSPGMDRQLFEQKDYEKFTGELVDVKLYKGIEGCKEFQGILKGIKDNRIEIEEAEGKCRFFELEEVAKTSLAVVF
ncbi:MAG: ribosome maturation factor RimP [Hornefia sp.]|nr:ribosome maturation factor RimP [Hornefia sp.]